MALATLIADRGGQYQICGPSAFSRYGWDDQIPNRLYAYNNRLWGERKIGVAAMTLIKLADERLGETEIVKTPEGIEATRIEIRKQFSPAVQQFHVLLRSRFAELGGRLRRLAEAP